jgi:hypothetical protein
MSRQAGNGLRRVIRHSVPHFSPVFNRLASFRSESCGPWEILWLVTGILQFTVTVVSGG